METQYEIPFYAPCVGRGDLTAGEQISPLIKVTAWQGGTGMLCSHFASGPFPSREAPARWYLSADNQEQPQQAAVVVISVQDCWYCCLYTRGFCRPEVVNGWSDVPSPTISWYLQASWIMYCKCRCWIRKQALFGGGLPRCHNSIAELWCLLAFGWSAQSAVTSMDAKWIKHVFAAKLESDHQLISHQLLERFQVNRKA